MLENDNVRRPNLPAEDYWINNNNNSFKKNNVANAELPKTGTLPAATEGAKPENKKPKTGALPATTSPKTGTAPAANRNKTAPAVTVPIMAGQNGGMVQGTMQQTRPQVMGPMMPQGNYTGMIPASPQPSGSMPAPGALMTCDMGTMVQNGVGGVAEDQLAARCGRVTDLGYIQGYLRTQIGRHVKIEFVVGTNMFIDREGYLIEVGVDYLIINEVETDDYLLCDMYSIKFVKIFY